MKYLCGLGWNYFCASLDRELSDCLMTTGYLSSFSTNTALFLVCLNFTPVPEIIRSNGICVFVLSYDPWEMLMALRRELSGGTRSIEKVSKSDFLFRLQMSEQ